MDKNEAHKWLDEGDMEEIRRWSHFGEPDEETEDLNAVLSDLDAAKALLKECRDILGWIGEQDELQKCGDPETIKNENDLLSRIRSVPGLDK